MASPVADIGQSHQHHPVTESAAESAFQEAQKWIEVSHGAQTLFQLLSTLLPCHAGVVLSLCGLSYRFAAGVCRVSSFKRQFDFIASSPVER